MEKGYFPMFVDISGMKILVAGGGRIAVRRVNTLLEFAENIRVVAPEICGEMKRHVEAKRIKWDAEVYDKRYLTDVDLVLAATNIKEVNQRIAGDCRRMEEEYGRRIIVNVADDKALCDFYFPSIVKQEDIVIGINSGGRNPGKVKQIRRKLENFTGI